MTDKPVSKPTSTPAPAARGGAPDPFAALRRRMESVFDDFGAGLPGFGRELWGGEFGGGMQDWMGGNWGAVDVTEKGDAYRFAVELPGCDEKDIELSAANGLLVIRAEKKQERTDERESTHLSERRYGSFQRSFRLPDGVDLDRIEAHFAKGVLEITVPKSAQAAERHRKIEIKTS